jgi:hypothetical protein
MLTCFISIIYRFVAESENCYENAYAAYNNVDIGVFGKFRRSVNYRNFSADVLNSHRERTTLVSFLDRNTRQDNNYRNFSADVLNSHRDRITLVPFLDHNTRPDNDYRNTNLQIQAT